MKKTLLAMLFGSALVLGACGGNDKAKEETTNEKNGSETAAVDAQQIIQSKCISCHGENLEGQGNFPNISKIGATLSKKEILDVINNGKNGMPGGLITGDDADAVAQWLSKQK
ncbi:cytochrome c551 [Viridibacillus sp. FSL R5-0477]|uniref:Cytochrome C class I n=1 Tax=Viridibacillus arenosi FSL R5-213 TaxID=1227360 RepID=W4EN81_9BACL|nr:MULTISPECIES: cytochrome c [Viridibacillus]ETT82038.1 cytochrome C class I [Viridibacillus arenosi FSL R5-213]OMC81390.1 cytochrome C-553 [Viridibacillus sp. FSL H8-0123]OMC86813.1 cytochrome C-553 [Viridibacillus sp. FSL H7-0596]OMC90433.1 cytochrome C-553 [Viridibacillus arenosi]